MAHIGDVIEHLRPNGGWVLKGNSYEDIEFLDNEPAFTKAEFEAAFDVVDQLKADKIAADEAAKVSAVAKLTALGLTKDDLKALGL